MNRKLPAGHGWAYLGVTLGLAASIAGNVANTVLVPSAVPLELRVPFAVAWPVFLGIGIEVLTRVAWERNWRHWAARALLVGPMSLVAAVMSYLHLHHLMVLSGEPGLAQAVGPLAVDGTLFGCTVALLVTRAAERMTDTVSVAGRQTLAQRVAAIRTAALDVRAAAAGQLQVQDPAPAEDPEVQEDPAPVSPTPVPVSPAVVLGPYPPAMIGTPVSPAPRRTRPGTVDVVKVMKLTQEYARDSDVADLAGCSPKTAQRVRRAARLVRDMAGTSDADIATTVKLNPIQVAAIRAELENLAVAR